jgi:hypothetical protein
VELELTRSCEFLHIQPRILEPRQGIEWIGAVADLVESQPLDKLVKYLRLVVVKYLRLVVVKYMHLAVVKYLRLALVKHLRLTLIKHLRLDLVKHPRLALMNIFTSNCRTYRWFLLFLDVSVTYKKS